MLVSHLLTTNVILPIENMLENRPKRVFLQNRLDKSMIVMDKTTFAAKKWDTNTKFEALVTFSKKLDTSIFKNGFLRI